MSKKLVLKGIGVLNPTPLTPDDRLNEQEYRRHLRWLVECGVGWVQPVAGATGQAMQTSEEEWKRILEITVEEAKGRALITAYTTRPSTSETIRLTRLAREIGADCGYLIQPFLTLADGQGMYEHFRAVAEAVDLPLALYNNPVRGGAPIPLDVVERLVDEYDNFVALKQTDQSLVVASFRRLRRKITVWPRLEQDLLMGLAMGSPGILAFAAAVAPAEFAEVVRRWEAGDHQGARALQFRLMPLMDAMYMEPIPGCTKYLLNRMGWDFGRPRLPGHEVSRETAEKLDRVLRDLGKI